MLQHKLNDYVIVELNFAVVYRHYMYYNKLWGFLKCPVVFAKCPHSARRLLSMSLSGCMCSSFFAGQTVGYAPSLFDPSFP